MDDDDDIDCIGCGHYIVIMMPGNDHYDRNRHHIHIGTDLDDRAVSVVFLHTHTHTHTNVKRTHTHHKNIMHLRVEGFGV